LGRKCELTECGLRIADCGMKTQSDILANLRRAMLRTKHPEQKERAWVENH
jgi:hypothetical protein